jgi:hypothetical protein
VTQFVIYNNLATRRRPRVRMVVAEVIIVATVATVTAVHVTVLVWGCARL